MKKLLALFILVTATLSFAREHQVIDTLGASKKGQYVALEEYGYEHRSHTYYVRISVINVWTSEYVGRSVDVALPARGPGELKKARSRARQLVQGELTRFGIRG
jgi:predicted secreted protein